MLSPSERKVIILCASAILIGGLALAGATALKSRHQTALSQATPTPAPQVQAKKSAQPAFSDADILLNYGLSSYQLSDTKNAFYKYAPVGGSKITSISVDPTSIVDVPTDPGAANSTKTLEFTGQFDGKTAYKAHLDFFDITTARLYLLDPTGKQIYDSGNIDLYDAQ